MRSLPGEQTAAEPRPPAAAGGRAAAGTTPAARTEAAATTEAASAEAGGGTEMAADPGGWAGDPRAATVVGAIGRVRRRVAFGVAGVALVGSVLIGVSIGPVALSIPTLVKAFVSAVPFLPRWPLPRVDSTILWQVRLPRVALGAVVGAMLAGGGAAYQGVFRNPLADPYLLGVAAGGGLGATVVIISGAPAAVVPPAAFAGAVVAVVLTYALGASAARGSAAPGVAGSAASIVLAGVAVAALFTALQVFLQQKHLTTLQDVYSWVLGRLTLASWSDVAIVCPYAAVSAAVLLANRRGLDVLRVGEAEASSLGVDTRRLRLVVVGAATLGTAAAVAVSGLIGFVGIIVPHTVRLTASASYRLLMPLSMLCGAAFLVLADVAARTVQAPAEIPIGVVTAVVGAPFFLIVLRSRRRAGDAR